MPETSNWRRLVAVTVVAAGGLASACSGDDGTTAGVAADPAVDAEETSTTFDEAWRDEALALCDAATSGIGAIAPPSFPNGVRRYIADFAALHAEIRPLRPRDLPPELTEAPNDLLDLFSRSDELMALAQDQLAEDKVEGEEFSDSALGSIDLYRSNLNEAGTVLALAGLPCGLADPARAAHADLNVPISTAWQVETGFDSVWVSQEIEDTVNRIDPETGALQAAIDVGARPVKLQPADGRMLVRTDLAYVAIDPATNAVTDSVAKAEVGPAANRSWAVDGALWICDGPQLHRYSPKTLEPLTTIELDLDCGQVYATDDLVVVWPDDEDPAQSGTSFAAFIDPATNGVLETVHLPVDVNVPIVLDDTVYFPPTSGSSQPVLVDRTGWTAAVAPKLGGDGSGSQSAYDGDAIYVIIDKHDVAVVDPTTFEVTDTIPAFDFSPPLGGNVNSVAVGPGALWVVNDEANILQRFDRPD